MPQGPLYPRNNTKIVDSGMAHNIDDCNVIHISKDPIQRDYQMNGRTFNVVQQEKDLGVLLSNNLKVSAQCQQACSKALNEYLA